jgi:uncharacterized membrane protein
MGKSIGRGLTRMCGTMQDLVGQAALPTRWIPLNCVLKDAVFYFPYRFQDGPGR